MSAKRKGDTKEHPLSSSDEIRHLAGPIADHTVVAVLEAGATIADLEAALIYARGEGNYIDRLGHSLSGLNLRSLRCLFDKWEWTPC